MRMASMGFSSLPSITSTSYSPFSIPIIHQLHKLSSTTSRGVRIPRGYGRGEEVDLSCRPELSRASQAIELFPSVCPQIVVRDVRLEDCWEVAETHCSSFFPRYRFPWGLLLRINRYMGLLSGFSMPSGCHRTILVAVTSSGHIEVDGFEDKYNFSHEFVAGILTLDTMADFLPRKGPQRLRRTGIAYISNVAVRSTHRRKGIAKRLIAEAEAQASRWGCRSVALHCDAGDSVATSLYQGQGFKCIKIPDCAKWPTPKASPETQFRFMMKLLSPSSCGGW